VGVGGGGGWCGGGGGVRTLERIRAPRDGQNHQSKPSVKNFKKLKKLRVGMCGCGCGCVGVGVGFEP
jgi:hypothetical protein